MRRRHAATHPYQEDQRGPRIQKVLADAGVGSRRACEAAVEEGRVTVNGHRIDGLPAWVNAHEDDIRVDGRRILAAKRGVYVMLFKPKGVVSTNSDPEGRPRAIDLVEHPTKARLYPVGRLDIDSSGLLLLTNDGPLANRLTHPRFEMHKGYEVTVGGRIADDEIERLERSVFPPARDDREASDANRSQLKVLKRDATRTLLYMELRESRNRQVRRMLATFGHPVKKLRRVRMGPLQLKGLQAGQWRELTARELATLREAAFATPQERARPKRRAAR
jgi:pseudouridine synthase